MRAIAASLRTVTPLPARYMVVGCAAGGAIGGIAGLLLGLSNPATAWFAVIEAGIPAMFAGGFLGLAIGGLVAGLKSLRASLRRLRPRQN